MIFQNSKLIVIWIMLTMLTACTPPNYAPVKTVNQTFEPNNGYVSKKPPINLDNTSARQQESAKAIPQKQQNQPVQQNPIVTETPYPVPYHNRPLQTRSAGKTVKKQATSPLNTVIADQNPKSRKLIPLPYKVEANKKNSLTNYVVDSSLIAKQQKFPVKNQQINGRSKNKLAISTTNIIALREGQQHKTQTANNQFSAPKNIKEKKSIISIDNKKMLKLNFQWPMRGKISRNFSQTDNKGIDITGNIGQAVRAAEAGKAVYCGQGLAGFGNLVIIKHDGAYLSAYANNSQLNIKEGQQVKKGQTIGQVGLAGLKRTPLHFEIRKNGKSINPLTLLPKH